MNISELKVRIESLKEHLSRATGRDEFLTLQNESRELLKQTFQTEFEEESRLLFREIREKIDSVKSLSNSPYAAKQTGLNSRNLA